MYSIYLLLMALAVKRLYRHLCLGPSYPEKDRFGGPAHNLGPRRIYGQMNIRCMVSVRETLFSPEGTLIAFAGLDSSVIYKAYL